MRSFDAAAIRSRLPWPRMLAALDAMLRDEVSAPLRANHPIRFPRADATLLLMPAWQRRRIGVKLVTVFPGNAARNERAVGAVYALFDARDGRPLAMFDGEELTARRTAGASAYAASCLARADARRLTLVGSGRLARGLVEAHMHVRSIERVSLWSRTPEHAQAAAAMAGGLPVTAVRDLERAVRDADVLRNALDGAAVRGAWLRPACISTSSARSTRECARPTMPPLRART
jgi:ornithine cyclodeaminase